MSGPLPAADPDSRARTHLANERTFLAWFRTGLTLVALGIAAAQFLSIEDASAIPVVQLLATAMVVTGLTLIGVGARRYQSGRAHIDATDFRPANLSVVIASVAALVTGLLAIAFVWLLQPG